jgi:predicted permease
MLQDIKIAWRFLAKRKTSTAVAVVTLGVAIAIATLAVGIVDQAFWRAANVVRGDELVTLYNSRPAAPQFQALSYPDYVAARDRLRGDVEVAAFVRISNTLGGDAPAQVWGELVSGNYFDVQRTKAVAGRLLTAADDRAGGNALVLAEALWRRSFGADPSIVGRAIRIGRDDYAVVGIAPRGFHGPAWSSEFWVPLSMSQRVFGADVLSRPEIPFLQTVGRPIASVGLTELDARVRTFETSGTKDGWTLTAYPGLYLRFWPAYRATVARFLSVFLAIAICILVVACANLAGLLIARAGERQRELALRQALGASRVRLARRLAAESVVLIALGGAAGVLFTFWGAMLVERVPAPVPIRLGVTADLRLGLISAGVSLAGALLFTLLSAFKGFRTDIRSVLVSSATTLAPGAHAQRLLAVTQVAICCVMLTVGGLLLRSAWQVEAIDVGFDTTHAVFGSVLLRDQGYDAPRAETFYRELRARLAAHAEIESVAYEWNAPLAPVRVTTGLSAAGLAPVQTRYNVVSAGYFKTLRIALRSGREFDDRDRSNGQPVAIVNETLAARFNGDPIGQTLKLSTETVVRTVVGVAREIKYNGITEPSQPFAYLPSTQVFRPDMFVHVRARADGAAALLRAAVREIDPHVALSEVRTLADQLDAARSTPRISAFVSSGAAALAVLLALVGLYGVLATTVEQRTRELAIRSALGAPPRAIVRRIVLEGLTLTSIGVVLGMIASGGVGRLLIDLLYGVGPRDPLVIACVPAMVLAISALAWMVPARRAAAVNPIEVLRSA